MWLKTRTKAKSVKSWCDPRPIPECPGGPWQPLGGCRAGGLCHTPGAFPQDRGAVPHSWGIPTGQGGLCHTPHTPEAFPHCCGRTGGLCHAPWAFPHCWALLAQPRTLRREGSREGGREEGVAQPVLGEGRAAWPGPSGALEQGVPVSSFGCELVLGWTDHGELGAGYI